MSEQLSLVIDRRSKPNDHGKRMSVWQKTLLYLGLVDEDELAAETSAKGGQSTDPNGPYPSFVHVSPPCG